MRSPSRRRGATYTFLTIVFSSLLLGSATIFLGSTVNAYELAVLQRRRTALREAAYGGLRWACADAAAAVASDGRGKLLLAGGVEVQVQWRRFSGADDVVATAEVGSAMRVTGTLVRHGKALVIEQASPEAAPR